MVPNHPTAAVGYIQGFKPCKIQEKNKPKRTHLDTFPLALFSKLESKVSKIACWFKLPGP